MRPDGTSPDERRRLEESARKWREMAQDPEKARELLRAMGILTAGNKIAEAHSLAMADRVVDQRSALASANTRQPF
jgi:ribulose-5-phosphate 4-epimerase/fuculose-1-phosphate aldolase